MEHEIRCPECGKLVNIEELQDCGIVHCSICASRLVPGPTMALTYVDEMPETEYLGG